MADHVRTGASHSRGFTLTELLIVVVIIGILGAVAAPVLRSGDPEKLNFAAAQLAEAMRYARSETMRTGVIHAIRVLHDQERYAVARADLSVEPFGTFDIARHPLTRQLYDVELDANRQTSGIQIANTSDVFNYPGLGQRDTLAFIPTGVPVYIRPLAGEIYHLGANGVQLKLGEHIRTISVQSFTGRVTVQ